MIGYFVFILYFIWLFLTIIIQFHEKKLPVIANINKFDKLHMIPVWTFFAPNPGNTDLHLVYRDIDEAGVKITSWIEVEIPKNSRSIFFIWHPFKKLRKIISDSIAEIKELYIIFNKEDINDNIIKTSLGYLNLLNIVVTLPNKSENAVFRQFAIIESQGFTDNKILIPFYLSSYHKM